MHLEYRNLCMSFEPEGMQNEKVQIRTSTGAKCRSCIFKGAKVPLGYCFTDKFDCVPLTAL